MRFKSTYILLALAVGLSFFVYFHEIRGGKTREESEEKSKKAILLDETKIKSIEITRPGAEPLRAEKKEDGWWLTSPLSVRANEGEIGGMTYQLANLTINQVVSESAADLAAFGLITPEIELKLSTDKENYTILFGADTPLGFDAYLQVKGDKRIVSVSRSIKQAVNKQASELRDKRVVVYDQAALAGIEIVTGEVELKFEKDAKGWRMTAPTAFDTADEKIQGILDELTTLEAEEFVPQVVAQSQALGDPSVSITLVIGKDARTRKKLSFWSIENGEKAYTYPEGEAWFYKIASPNIIKDSAHPAQYFREKRVLVFDQFNLSKVVFTPDPKTGEIVIEKDDKGDWNITKPSSAKGQALSSRIFDFIDSLNNIEAVEFIDEALPDNKTGFSAAPTVVLYGKGDTDSQVKEIAKLFIGAKYKESLSYARGSGPQIFAIDIEKLNWPKTAGDFSKPSPAPQPGQFSYQFE